jgi:hypothetical protein
MPLGGYFRVARHPPAIHRQRDRISASVQTSALEKRFQFFGVLRAADQVNGIAFVDWSFRYP